MTEKEANIHLEQDHDDIFFGGKFHDYVNYAAVIKHPFIPNEFAIEVAGIDVDLHYIENYVKRGNLYLLNKLGFDKHFIEKLQTLDNNLESTKLLQIINTSQDFSNLERKKIVFNSNDIYHFDKEIFEYLSVKSRVAEHFLKKDIFIENETKIILPVEEEKRNKNLAAIEIKGGISISNEESSNCAGTLGGLFTVEGSECLFGIANAHVLKNTKLNNYVKSPGNSKIGTNGEVIGEIVQKSFEGLDVAVIKMLNNTPEEHSIINNYFSFSNIKSNPILGSKVKKFGITTGHKEGIILSKNASVQISIYGESHFFKNQIMCSPLVLKGDSGSILANENGNIIGLLFAKSKNNTVCFANSIEHIKEYLQKNNIKIKSFV